MNTRLIILLLLCFYQWIHATGVPEYDMSNLTVSDCKGVLYDNGGPTNNYTNNSNLTFTICLNTNTPLTLTFEQFCVEQGFDSLMIFDGPNAQAPQIGLALAGVTLPQPIIINNGCVTLVFRTDANVTCSGFRIRWSSLIIPPSPPAISLNVNPPFCNQTQFTIQLSKKLLCDSVYQSAVQVAGASNPTIISATPLPCSGDSTQAIQVQLNPGFAIGGVFTISLTTNYRDVCDSVWTFVSTAVLNVLDCPISVNITASDSVLCSGQCIQIQANATGGNGIYTYQWSNGLPNSAGPHTICLNSNAAITVIVDDTSPAVAAQTTKSFIVFQKPNAPADFTLCQSADSLLFNANPPNGTWSGNGMSEITSGLFYPDSAGGGAHPLIYAIDYANGFQCFDTTMAIIFAIDAGLPQAACPLTPPFQLIGAMPLGGTWSGPFTSPLGLFDPQILGVYLVTYTQGTCSDTKWVYVNQISNIPSIVDTLCQSDASVQYLLDPPGGRWQGAGIVDSLNGTFDPGESGGGLHIITYSLNGCAETVQVFVNPVFAGWNQSACPSQTAFMLANFYPVGGTWSGTGMADVNTGLFDPQSNSGNDFNTELIYSAPNGCTDTLMMYVIKTQIQPDTVRFCRSSNDIQLFYDGIGNLPWGGQWTGNGIIVGNDADSSFFSPAFAGGGLHVLYYDINTCRDSVIMVVEDQIIVDTDENVCENSMPIPIGLVNYVNSGTWSGNFISLAGLFNPEQSGAGNFEFYFESVFGCTDTSNIQIIGLPNVSLSGLNADYCLQDTLIPLNFLPVDGVISGAGIVGNSFNPLLSGGGLQTIYIQAGEPGCLSTDSIQTFVKPPLTYTLTQSNDSLCYGDFASIQILAFAGVGQSISYQWSNDLPSAAQQIVSPTITSAYWVTLSDGCSILNDTVNLFVYPKIEFTVALPDTTCFGEPAAVTINYNQAFNYSPNWITAPPQQVATFTGNSGFTYLFRMIDLDSGCQSDSVILLPSYPLVFANFSITPNSNDCLDANDNNITFIDLSTGGTQGTWNFGNATELEYVSGQNPTQTYDAAGSFLVELTIANNFGCESKTSKDFCINNPQRIYIPNAFSLNGDGLNDSFSAVATGALKIKMRIYNRWQQLIFEETSLNPLWLGKTESGQWMMQGVYAYWVEVTWEDGSTFIKAGTVHLF